MCARATSPHPPTWTDEELLARYVSGDRAALGDLLQRHRRPLVEFLARVLRDASLAEDAFQEVCLRVLLHARDFAGRSKVSTWLFCIARNCALSMLRHQRSTGARAARPNAHDPQGRAPLDGLASSWAAPDQAAEAYEQLARLEGALGSLQEEQRRVFWLRACEGRDHKEIAILLGCPENTVKTRAFRAVRALAQRLMPADPARGRAGLRVAA